MLALVRGGRVRPLMALTIGTRDRVHADPAAVFRIALSCGAESVVLAHNHVDDVGPSAADLAVTRRLVAAGAVIGVPLLSHVVVTPSGWYDCVVSGEVPLGAWSG